MSSNPFPPFSILVVDDEPSILISTSGVLRAGGINNVLCLNDSREVMETLSGQESGVLLLDLTMPHISGQELLRKTQQEYPDLIVIIITGDSEVSMAVKCMKSGAFDYLVKPVENSKMLATVKRAIEIQELKRENRVLKEHLFTKELENPEAFSEIITRNEKMRSIHLYVEAIAKTAQTVLITGETGVGKELIARVIHNLSGRQGDLISVNVAGFDDNMFADTLFGHKKGAFTGADELRRGLIEAASGGTLFLDEIGDLSLVSQVKLLRLLDTGEFLPIGSDVGKSSDARIIVATNKDVNTAVDQGSFRRDLYYRLQTHRVHIPPIKERLNDLQLLVDHFLEISSKDLGIKKPTVPNELLILLENYDFPGNIRELQAMIYDAVSRLNHTNRGHSNARHHKSGFLSLDSFKKALGQEIPASSDELGEETPVSFSSKLPTIKQATKLLIEEALRRSRGRQTIAAQLLGISQQALSKRLKQQNKK